MIITSMAEATAALRNLLLEMRMEIIKIEELASRKKFGNTRIYTESGDIYHLKFSKKLFTPRENVKGGAADLDKKLKFVISEFGQGDDSLNGIDEDLLLELVDFGKKGNVSYFVTVMTDGRVLWKTGLETYDFILRYDTIMHFPRAFSSPVCFVPTGWLTNRSNLVTNWPSL